MPTLTIPQVAAIQLAARNFSAQFLQAIVTSNKGIAPTVAAAQAALDEFITVCTANGLSN